LRTPGLDQLVRLTSLRKRMLELNTIVHATSCINKVTTFTRPITQKY